MASSVTMSKEMQTLQNTPSPCGFIVYRSLCAHDCVVAICVCVRARARVCLGGASVFVWICVFVLKTLPDDAGINGGGECFKLVGFPL